MCQFCFTANTNSISETTIPPADITENDNTFRILMDIPGMKKTDLKIIVDDAILTVSGENKSETNKEYRPLFSETLSKKIKRSFLLWKNLDIKNIRAEFNNGVLSLTIPKTGLSVFDIPIANN